MSEDVLREKIKWRSHRGLLELDLFFTRFINEHLDDLSEQQLEDLLSLLDCDDIQLWSMVSGRSECEVEHWKHMVALLRDSAPKVEN